MKHNNKKKLNVPNIGYYLIVRNIKLLQILTFYLANTCQH